MTLPESAANAETLENLLKLARSAPAGNFVEIGVWQGGCSWRLYKIAEEQNRKLHLFDDFKGTYEQVKALCPKAIFHSGLFPESWDDGICDIAFCFYDIALPAGVHFIIEKMPKHFVKGGIILFYYTHSQLLKTFYRTINGRGNLLYPYLTKED